MAVHVLRSSTVPTIRRIRSRRYPAGHSRSCRDAVAAVREVVRRSATVDDAIVAVKAIDTAWSRTTAKACEASQFVLTILELSDSTAEAVSVVELLGNDPSLREPLEHIRNFVQAEFPGSRIHLAPGDDVMPTYLFAQFLADDYPSFKSGYDRIRSWEVENHPELGRLIHVSPRRLYKDV